MASPAPALTDNQLDVVQHPTLGSLKFPKDMPFDERNASIERLEKSSRPSEAQMVANRPDQVAPVPLPYTDKRMEAATGEPSSPLAKPAPLGPYGTGINSKSAIEDVTDAYKAGGTRRAIHTGVVDASQAFAPLIAPAAAAAPVATAVSLGTSAISQQVGKRGAQALGASEDTANLVGDASAFAGGYLGAKAPGWTAGPRQALAEKIVSPITYENLGETKADIRTDVNPERGVTREGMVGTKKGLAEEQIPARLTELKTAANNILQNHPNGGTIIDAEPMIDQAINNAIGETEKVAGGTERLENLRAALKTKYGPIRGTPAQINDLKTEIQAAARGVGAYKNTQPVEASVASAMGQAARLIRGRVDELIPEAADLNGRMSDLIDAQAGIRSKIAGERGQSMLGNHGRGVVSSVLNRTVGAAPVRTAVARAVNIGNTLDVPEPLPPRPGPAGLLPAAPMFTPPPDDTSGPVNLGAPERQPLADNRQLPAAGRTTGPRTVSGPSQFGVSLPEQTPRPLTGPERQLPEKASSGREESFDVPLGKQWTNQRPGPIELGPAPESGTSPSSTPAPRTPPKGNGGAIDKGAIRPEMRTRFDPEGKLTDDQIEAKARNERQGSLQKMVGIPRIMEGKGTAVELGIPAKPKPGESIFSKPIPNPRETANPKGMSTGREQVGNFDADTLSEAKEAVAAAHEQWSQFERPGRYVHNAAEMTEGSENPRPDIVAYGVKSARPQMEIAHPWIKNLPKLTSGKLRSAVESGKGVEWNRLVNEAAGQIQRAKEAAAPVLEEYRGQLEDAAKSVEKVDPDLAQTLRDLASGKYAGMRGHTAYLREKLDEAATADAFDKIFSEPLSQEVSGGAQELGPEAHQSREANQQAAELGPRKATEKKAGP